MNEEELRKNDILFQIDMQLYDEFNDKLATMNDHIGDIYSLRDVEEVEIAEKDRQIQLLRQAIKKLQTDNKHKDILLHKKQQQLELKDKVIDNLYSDIEYEYSGTGYLKSLEEYYEEVKNE